LREFKLAVERLLKPTIQVIVKGILL